MFRSHKDTVRTPVKTSKEAAKKYYCDLCDDDHQDRFWESESDVEIHRRRVHKIELIQLMKEPKNYMCSVCLRKQTDKASLIAHIKTDHLLSSPAATIVKRELFICDYCKNIFFNKLLLIAHIKFFHSLSNIEKRTATTTCPFCYKIIKIRSIWFHFLYHGIINTGTCPVCLISFDDYQDALKHTECHSGYYYCNICFYETEREALFLSHVEKHKKTINLEGKDVNKISRYFVPQKRASSWNRKVVNIFKGITLAPEIQICVLCRTLCETEEQMIHHIYGDHSPMNTVEIKRHMCVCGEEFFNRVLLKHHIFMLKGYHRVCDETPKITTQPEESIHNQLTDVLMQDDTAEGIVGIVIEINENISNPFTVPIKIDSDTTSNAITFQSQENKPENSAEYTKPISSQISMESQLQNDVEQNSEQDIAIQLQHEMDIQTPHSIQSQHEMDIQLLHGLNNESQEENNKQLQKEIHIQANNETDTNLNNKIVIQSHNDMDIHLNNLSQNDNSIELSTTNNSESMKLDPEPRRMITIESDNDIYRDQIILNADNYDLQLQNTPTEITIGSNSITIELINNDNPKKHTHIRRFQKRQSNQKNIVLLNNTLPKKFGASRQFYEGIIHTSEEIDEGSPEASVQYRYVLDSARRQIQHQEEQSAEEDVYDVDELPGDPNEDASRTIVEEALLFS